MPLDTFKNFARSTLASGIAAGATSATVATGEGAKFPAGTPFSVTIWNQTDYASPDLDPSVEIVRVTSRSTDVLTITRAYDSTTDVNHNTGGKTYGVAQCVIAHDLNTETRYKHVVVTTTATLTDETHVQYDTSAGAFTVTLPTIGGTYAPLGHEIAFYGYGASGTAVITLSRSGSDTIKVGAPSGASTNTTTLALAAAATKIRLKAVAATVWASI